MSEATLPRGTVVEPQAQSLQSPEAEGTASARTAQSKLYTLVWRWHFYAGLMIAPVLWIVTLTGALYVFKTELAAWRDYEIEHVAVGSERLSYDRLYELALQQAASPDVEAVIVHPETDRSVRFVAHIEGEGGNHAGEQHQHLYLDPYTGKLLATRIAEEDFFSIVLELHRSLMLGTMGRILSELVTSWGLLLMASGVYLWWPRGKKNIGVWVPRIRGKFYTVLRDWHAVVGAYLMPLVGIVALTGMFFTLVWGTGFNTTVQKVGHWPNEWFVAPPSPPQTPEAKPAPLDQIVPAFLAQARPEDFVAIRLASQPEQPHMAFLLRDENKNDLRVVVVDQYTAEVLNVSDGYQQPFLYRVRLWAVSIHMGKIFGLPTKILALLASLVLFALSITGLWMWWLRRPQGRTGFPRRPLPRSLPLWGWCVVLLAGLILPVAGLSILLIAGGDYLWQRWQKSRRPAPASV